MAEPTIVGLLETIELRGNDERRTQVTARIDTGAQNSAIDLTLAQELQLGPIMATKRIKSSHGNSLRPVVQATLVLGGRTITDEFTLYNRAHMKFKVLVGQNILKKGFFIDPNKE